MAAEAKASVPDTMSSDTVTDLQNQLTKCQNDYSDLHEKMNLLESYSRRNNLIFEGLPENKNEDLNRSLRQILSDLSLDLDMLIVACHRLGPYNHKSMKPRAIIVKFMKFTDRNAVWGKRTLLKGTKTWIKEDYPHDIEKRRQELWPYLRAAYYEDPANPGGRVSAYMKLDKLVVNNQSFSSDMIDKLPHYIQHRALHPPSTISTKDVTIFFHQQSPLSNFHPSDMNIDGQMYCCVEQYLSYQKALLFGSEDIANQIFDMNDPKEMKFKVKFLENFDASEWEVKSPDILLKALKAKFTQNSALKDELMSTNKTVIGEASPSDNLFGIGFSLHNSNAKNPTKS